MIVWRGFTKAMTAPAKLLGRWRAATSGATAIEFAIVLPVFLAVIMGIMEFGRMFWVQSTLQHSVEQTARLAMAEYTRESFTNANFSTWFSTWETSLQTDAPSEVFGFDPSAITFTATTSTVSAIDYVSIDASYSFSFIFPVIPGTSSIGLTALSKTPLVGK
jgi:Flp pilus assembly protein TadG